MHSIVYWWLSNDQHFLYSFCLLWLWKLAACAIAAKTGIISHSLISFFDEAKLILMFTFRKHIQHFKKFLKCQNTIVIVSENAFSLAIDQSCLYHKSQLFIKLAFLLLTCTLKSTKFQKMKTESDFCLCVCLASLLEQPKLILEM